MVLDALADHVFLRDDELAQTFQLSQTQMRRILEELQQEAMVQCEEVKERGRRKGDREAEEAEREGVAGTTVVMTQAEAEAAKARRVPRSKRELAISTLCWYINPRWFVDEVRFRIACVNEVLRRRQEGVGMEKALRCPSCGARMSIVEAVAARAGGAASSGRAPAKRARRTAGGSAAPAETGFVCPKDGAVLERVEGETAAARAARAAAKWQSQLRHSGLPAMLDDLERMPLGANRPADHLRENRVTLRQTRASAGRGGAAGPGIGAAAFGGDRGPKGYGTRTGLGEGLGGEPGRQRGGVFRLQERSVRVRAADGVSETMLAAAAAAAMGQAGGAAALAREEAAEGRRAAIARETAEEAAARALPEHLRRSAITGETTSTLGFVRLADRSQHKAAIAALAEAVWSSDDDDDDDGAVGGAKAAPVDATAAPQGLQSSSSLTEAAGAAVNEEADDEDDWEDA